MDFSPWVYQNKQQQILYKCCKLIHIWRWCLILDDCSLDRYSAVCGALPGLRTHIQRRLQRLPRYLSCLSIYLSIHLSIYLRAHIHTAPCAVHLFIYRSIISIIILIPQVWRTPTWWCSTQCPTPTTTLSSSSPRLLQQSPGKGHHRGYFSTLSDHNHYLILILTAAVASAIPS